MFFSKTLAAIYKISLKDEFNNFYVATISERKKYKINIDIKFNFKSS